MAIILTGRRDKTLEQLAENCGGRTALTDDHGAPGIQRLGFLSSIWGARIR
jgi:hypothetical protein